MGVWRKGKRSMDKGSRCMESWLTERAYDAWRNAADSWKDSLMQQLQQMHGKRQQMHGVMAHGAAF